jgi:hypothetical protein
MANLSAKKDFNNFGIKNLKRFAKRINFNVLKRRKQMREILI